MQRNDDQEDGGKYAHGDNDVVDDDLHVQGNIGFSLQYAPPPRNSKLAGHGWLSHDMVRISNGLGHQQSTNVHKRKDATFRVQVLVEGGFHEGVYVFFCQKAAAPI